MRVEITKTTPLFRHPGDHGVFLQWLVHEPPLFAKIQFTIERSGSPEGPWDLVLQGLDGFHFMDRMRHVEPPKPGDPVDDLNYLALTRTVYYRVTALSSDGAIASHVIDVGTTLPRRELLLKRKMQRDLLLGFRFNGVDVAVLKRRHWGLRCRHCFDNLTKKVTKSKCLYCYGTGFEGGYFHPVRITGRFLAPNQEVTLTPQGKSDTRQIRFICSEQPIIDPDDILVEIATNQRYLVLAQTRTLLRRETVHQSIIASELSKDSAEYTFVANYDHIPPIY